MATKTNKVKQAVEAAMAGIEDDVQIIPDMTPPPDSVQFTPATLEVVQLLSGDPILAKACVEWVKVTRAKMATAQLIVLYGSERVRAMQDAERERQEKASK